MRFYYVYEIKVRLGASCRSIGWYWPNPSYCGEYFEIYNTQAVTVKLIHIIRLVRCF